VPNSGQIRVGTSGWSYKDWEGVFYPPEMKTRKQHALEYIAQCFDVVEINTSFYRHIRPEFAKLWVRRAEAVNPNFVFTAKLHHSFTHAASGSTSAASINPNDEDERLAREGLNALAATGKLHALLVQFPYSFKNTPLNREYIEILSRQFIEFPCVVEVRESGWNHPDTIEFFRQRNISFCNIDQPFIREELEPTEHVTSSVGYVRLHGRNAKEWYRGEERYNYLYNEIELIEWKERIERIAQKAEVTYVLTNNTNEAKATVNALQLKHMLIGQRVKAAETLLRHYPELKKIAVPLEPEDADLLPFT
jgi:uncharacterized protein YecE (DUF72 family)